MATNFLEYSGGTNGFLTAPVTLLTTELNALANGSGATQSVAGNFTQSSFGSGIWGAAHLQWTTTFTPTAGGYVAAWFLYSPDGGTTFEQTIANTDLPRAADIVIPLYASALTANLLAQANSIIRIPWWTTKMFFMNHAGVALPATGNILKLGSVAVQY